ncbi:MAG TPA: 3-oxoacyl-[acyl-carrier-protein] synthase III C-terminal domain-containing protein [Geomonas sp.]|nr:3-oxoacyl-[acyl-carrier-protein] synthase III C-terminal domain-containing protein [Geomonas sp.]
MNATFDSANSHNSRRSAYVASVASVVPSCCADQKVAADLVREHFRDSLTARSLGQLRATFLHPSIKKRHFAVREPAEIFCEDADQRIARFTEQAVELAAQAVESALAKVGVGIGEVSALVVNTCTGYICPGISTYLIDRLGLSRGVRLYDMVGSGCGGAIPNLQLAESMVKTDGGIVVSVSVEICSAAFQMGNDLSLIVSNAVFADGAAAVVLWDRPAGFQLVASAGHYVPEQRDSIRFVHKQGELHNQLSMQLPDLVRTAAAGVVEELLARASLKKSEIGQWAMHTGGEKIIDAVRDEVGIPEDLLWATRKVLAEYGNMSSPTVLFVLDELLQEGIRPGEWCVMLGYGAGLSAHGYLLRKT